MKKNLSLKILALVVAILLWIQQALLKEHTTDIFVPLKFENVPSNYVILPPNSQEISVTVKSSGNGNIRFNEIIINFNVVTVRTNKNTTALSAVIISCNVSGNIVVSNGTCTVGVTINTPTIVFVMVPGKII